MQALERLALSLALSVSVLLGLASQSNAAETIKIGTLKITAGGPLYVAKERGYFARQGFDADIVFTDSPQTMGQAVIAGDLNFTLATLTAAFFNVASGKLRIVAEGADEWPGFTGLAVAASNPAFDGGLSSLKALANHSLALPTVGSTQQYDLSLLASKYGFDDRTVKILQLGSLSNSVAAVVGGTADATITGFSWMKVAVQDKKLHLLAKVSDETTMQLLELVTSAKNADDEHDRVERFLTAYRQGVRDFHDAFTGPDETRRDGPTAPDIYAIMSKYQDQPIDIIKLGVGHIDREARLDTADVLRQIAFFKSRGMVNPEVNGNELIDSRYVIPLSDK